MSYDEFNAEMARIEREYDQRESAEIQRLAMAHQCRYDHKTDNYWCTCGATVGSWPEYALHVIKAARE